MAITILGIESSCDDTSAAIIRDGLLLSNVIASQSVHEEYGGVVPELASRAHQQNIVPVVDAAIRRAGMKAGVALNPATSLGTVEEILPYVDMVLLMTVNPGFGGQSFIEGVVPKIERLHAMITERGLNVDIQVDGGVNAETSKLVKAAGANVLVAGSYVYGAEDTAAAIASLK